MTNEPERAPGGDAASEGQAAASSGRPAAAGEAGAGTLSPEAMRERARSAASEAASAVAVLDESERTKPRENTLLEVQELLVGQTA